VARILVADDNSNIQKMVGLALKDQGIDVVAVGNGEAAVRKISDIRPDLVLADVFMPVRNGYEVCQYVKSDSTLAHIPVILLVGAFDPLDEQEAQRVGADGVLKKPFVPPDPLISMVKSALARAGVSVGGVAPPPPVQEEPIRVAEMLTPRTTAGRGLPSMSSMAPVPEFPTVESEPVPEEVSTVPAPVKIDAGSQPLAFGNLLESPTTESEDDIAYATTTARPELERDWKSGDKDDEVEEEEEEDSHSASWRRDAGGDESEEEPAATGPAKDWRETAFSEAPARKMRDDSWAPQKEVSGFQEAAETEQSVGAMVTDAPISETRLPPPAIAPFTEDAWVAALKPSAAAVEAATMEQPAPAAQEQHVAPEVVAKSSPEVQAEIPAFAPAKAETPAEPEKPAGNSWFSSVPSPWDAEAQKASRLASTWDTPTASAPEASAPAANAAPETPFYSGAQDIVHEEAAKEDPAATVDALAPVLSEEARARVVEAALPAATVEAIREEAQHVAETAVQQTPAVHTNTNAKAPEPSMEDLVAKVLAKMNPDMLQAVTRDILKNVVESMVKDELNAKK
jgi:CheY-like chemotaxis protein